MNTPKIAYDFEKIAYIIDLQGPITTNSSEKPIDSTITSLFKSKQALQSATSSVRLEETIDLTEKLICHLQPKTTLWQKAFGSATLQNLHTLLCEFEQRLRFLDATQQVEADRALKTSPPDIVRLATCYHTARPPLRSLDTFGKIQQIVKQGLAAFLLDPAIHNLDALFPLFFTVDPLLEWTSSFAAQHPRDQAVMRVISALQKVDKTPLNTSEALAKLFYTVYTQANSDLTVASALLAPIQRCLASPQADANWQEAIDCIAKTALGGTRYDLLFFVLLETAKLCIRDKSFLAVLKSGIAYLISKQEDFNLIQKLIFNNPGDESAEHIVSALNSHGFASSDTGKAKKIMVRFWQIATIPDAATRLSKPELLRLAYFIETVLPQNASSSSTHHNKRSKFVQDSCPGMETSVEQDATTGATTILLRRKGTAFANLGGIIKKPRVALLIPKLTTEPAERVCRTVNNSFMDQKKTLPADTELLRELIQEAAVQKTFSHIRGIWKLISWCDYTTIKNGLTCTKVSMVTELAGSDIDRFMPPLMSPDHKTDLIEHTLREYHKRMDSTHPLLLIQILSNVAHGLKELHLKNIAHGDVKSANVFIIMDGLRLIKAGISDFGHSNPEVRRKHALGYYGTFVFSAPELFSRPSSINHTALDVWAFGCMLYAIFRRKDPSWICNVLNLKTQNEAMRFSAQEKLAMEAFITQEIEKPLEQSKPNPRTLRERIEQLTYHCLRLDPDKRWKMDQIYQELEDIAKIQ